MRRYSGMVAGALAATLVLAGAALAETKVEVKGVHLCCGACVKGVATALKDVSGVTPACDRAKKTVTITATDDAAAQRALDALVAAGYHGDTGSKTLVMKTEENLPKGKVKTITLTGIHNCCKSCCVAIKKAVGSVNGVSGDTATPKATVFEVNGDFDAAEVLKALNDAGFHFQLKK